MVKSILGRKAHQRKALVIQGMNALLKHKRICTTKSKAKLIALHIAPVITKARRRLQTDPRHAHRKAFDTLRSSTGTKILFNDVLPRVGSRPGGYTRVITLAPRPGDRALLAMLELVDYNTLLKKSPVSKTRRSRKRSNTQPVEGVKPQATDAQKSSVAKTKAPKK